MSNDFSVTNNKIVHHQPDQEIVFHCCRSEKMINNPSQVVDIVGTQPNTIEVHIYQV